MPTVHDVNALGMDLAHHKTLFLAVFIPNSFRWKAAAKDYIFQKIGMSLNRFFVIHQYWKTLYFFLPESCTLIERSGPKINFKIPLLTYR
jgi:hypothetical protein